MEKVRDLLKVEGFTYKGVIESKPYKTIKYIYTKDDADLERFYIVEVYQDGYIRIYKQFKYSKEVIAFVVVAVNNKITVRVVPIVWEGSLVGQQYDYVLSDIIDFIGGKVEYHYEAPESYRELIVDAYKNICKYLGIEPAELVVDIRVEKIIL